MYIYHKFHKIVLARNLLVLALIDYSVTMCCVCVVCVLCVCVLCVCVLCAEDRECNWPCVAYQCISIFGNLVMPEKDLFVMQQDCAERKVLEKIAIRITDTGLCGIYIYIYIE